MLVQGLVSLYKQLLWGGFHMQWWMQNTQRLIQTNLRATDAALDRDALLGRLLDLKANVLLLNTGGLVSFYPTDLPFHYRSPYLGRGDLTGDMVKRCHDNGIRFMARFDFSKIHESIFEKNPSWAYRSLSNEVVNYNGFVHTCVNGAFQKERSLDILREAMERYPIDGVFFNMFGYFTRDYSHNYHGICQCEACKSLFFERYQLPLPVIEDPKDPVFCEYQKFKSETVHEMLSNIRSLVKSFGEDKAVSTYTDDCVDIIKNESNTEIHRPYPLWEYSASENVQSVEGTYAQKTSSNVCINAVGLDYRFQGVPEPQVKVRLSQGLAAGSGMDFCIIGVFEDYPDRKSFSALKELFTYHAENEQYYGNFCLVDDAVLLKPGPDPTQEQIQEYLGLFRMLKEEHISFKVVEQKQLELSHLSHCSVIICPDLIMDDQQLSLLEESNKQILWTGCMWNNRPSDLFKKLFSLKQSKTIKDARWSYVQTYPKQYYPSLENTDWAILDGSIVTMEGKKKSIPLLEYVSAGTFGPPEMCQGNIPTNLFLGNRSENGRFQVLALNLGLLYKRFGYPEHKHLATDLIHAAIEQPIVQLKGFEQVEVFVASYPEAETPQYIVHLVNLSGFNGSTFFEPVQITDIPLVLSLPGIYDEVEVTSLVQSRHVDYTKENHTITINLDLLDTFEALVVRCIRK